MWREFEGRFWRYEQWFWQWWIQLRLLVGIKSGEDWAFSLLSRLGSATIFQLSGPRSVRDVGPFALQAPYM